MRTNNKLNPHMTPSPGIDPGPHWWEASALTTAPSLLLACTFMSYQNSETLKNRFQFQNVYGNVQSLKLHIWAKF